MRARADKANKQVSVHDGGNAEAHSRRFGATLWVFGHFNEHALPSNFWWGDVGGSCRVPPLCWTRVDMCIYILCGILLPLGCRVIPVVFFARPGVSSVRPRLDILTVRASCRLIARTLCVCDICALILPDMNAFVVLFALPFSAFQSQIRRGARDLKGAIIVL